MSKKLITTILTGVVFMSNMHIATLPVKAANNSDLSVPLENIVYVSPNGNAETPMEPSMIRFLQLRLPEII